MDKIFSKTLDKSRAFPLSASLNAMTGLLTVRVSPENSATAQQRNSATAQQRNSATSSGILLS
jgi:hypothetical protein